MTSADAGSIVSTQRRVHCGMARLLHAAHFVNCYRSGGGAKPPHSGHVVFEALAARTPRCKIDQQHSDPTPGISQQRDKHLGPEPAHILECDLRRSFDGLLASADRVEHGAPALFNEGRQELLHALTLHGAKDFFPLFARQADDVIRLRFAVLYFDKPDMAHKVPHTGRRKIRSRRHSSKFSASLKPIIPRKNRLCPFDRLSDQSSTTGSVLMISSATVDLTP